MSLTVNNYKILLEYDCLIVVDTVNIITFKFNTLESNISYQFRFYSYFKTFLSSLTSNFTLHISL